MNKRKSVNIFYYPFLIPVVCLEYLSNSEVDVESFLHEYKKTRTITWKHGIILNGVIKYDLEETGTYRHLVCKGKFIQPD